MKDLYVFAIGGSGERVMHSLLMMLAAGVKLQADRVVPVFVDNDERAPALKDCLELIRIYNNNPKGTAQQGHIPGKVGLYYLGKGGERGLGCKTTFAQTLIAEPILLNVAGSTVGNLGAIIGSLSDDDPMENSIKEERDLLFTVDDLNMPLNVGFVGNPNVGSVVLDSLSLSHESFTNIVNRVTADDGVYVIGSLFGGTGAAGFPLIVNKFKDLVDAPSAPLIGGVAILPYFKTAKSNANDTQPIDTQKYDVDPDTFENKTHAALMFYDDYMRRMDYLYYVGDQPYSVYKHCVGSSGQDNPVNLVEVMAALCVVDFTKRQRPRSVVYKRPRWRFAQSDGGNTVTNIGGIHNRDFALAIAKVEMLIEMLTSDDGLKKSIENNQVYVHNLCFNENQRKAAINQADADNNPEYWGIYNFIQKWKAWTNALSDKQSITRTLQILRERESPSITNVTQRFFKGDGDDLQYGIAKTEQKTVFEGFWVKKKTVPVSPDIDNALLSAYNKLGKPTDHSLSAMLEVISVALDDVLEHKCSL